MRDTTDRLTPMDLTVIRRRVDRDTVRTDDVLSLLDEVEALRAHVAELREALDLEAHRSGVFHGALARVVGEIPTGRLRGRLAEMVRDVERQLGLGSGSDPTHLNEVPAQPVPAPVEGASA